MRTLVFAAALSLAACGTGAGAPTLSAAPAACAVSNADRVWIDHALAAWRYSAREITGIGHVQGFQAILFDAHCTLTSPDALNAAHATWTATPHGETIALPGGQQIPVGTISFATSGPEGTFLVMSTPSVWRAGGVDNPGIGLETMMVAVLLHEGSHVSQSATYGARMSALAEANHLSEDFNDDSIQRRFELDAAFSASMQEETDLFFQAATAPDRATALRLARQARDMMKAREARYFTGADAYLNEAEDIWLTMEGSGQWAGYTWVIDPRGADVAPAIAIPNFARRSRWWSQNQGLGIFLTLDRLAGSGWKREVYGSGAHTVLQLLDAALSG